MVNAAAPNWIYVNIGPGNYYVPQAIANELGNSNQTND